MLNPGANVSGAVTLGDRVLIGSGATVLQGLRIGDDAVVGAGAVVTRDVAAGVTVVGVPAAPLATTPVGAGGEPVTRHALSTVTAPPEATLRDVLEVIDSSALAVALLVDRDGVLVGLLTDGDVRRAILGGAPLAAPAQPFATASPQTVPAGSGRAKVLDLMRALRIVAVPEVDPRGRLVGLHTLSDVIGAEPLPNPAVIMAGGRGTRLGGLTRSIPKPLMEVADRSILEWIVLSLVGGGIRDIQVSVNHLAEQIEEHLGDGSRLGCQVTYLREEPDLPLGTAGSLALFRAGRPDLDVPDPGRRTAT